MYLDVVERRLVLLNSDVCICHPERTPFVIEETRECGKARLTLSFSTPCFHVRDMDQRKFPLIKNQKCADHLIFTYDPNAQTWSLHIFEFKKSVSDAEWYQKILFQLDGGLTNAFAISGILNIVQFESITVYCCYRNNLNLRAPVYLRRPLGTPSRPPWTEGDAVLPSFPGLKIKKTLIPLNQENGEATIDIVEAMQ